MKHLSKTEGDIGQNVVSITIKTKSIVGIFNNEPVQNLEGCHLSNFRYYKQPEDCVPFINKT